jgi:hypothetical protein
MIDSSPNPAAVRLRALAHPLRWKLFGIVGREGTATATRCAELTGESVASCSYHLGMLGYVEQVPGSGKAFLEHEFDRMRSWQRLRESELEERDASGLGGSTMWITAEEMRQIHDEIWPILEFHTERVEDPSRPPPDARATRVFFFTGVSPRR